MRKLILSAIYKDIALSFTSDEAKVDRIYYRLIFCFLCLALCIVPGLSYAIDVNFENTSQRSSQQLIVRTSDSVIDLNVNRFDEISGFWELPGTIVWYGSPAEHISYLYEFAQVGSQVRSGVNYTGDKAIANINLSVSGALSSIPFDLFRYPADAVNYEGGAYAGIRTTLVTAPTANVVDQFWGKEVDGMPIVINQTIAKSHWGSDTSPVEPVVFRPFPRFPVNASTAPDYDYYYGKQEWGKQEYNPGWSVKPLGGGINAIEVDRLPEGYVSYDKPVVLDMGRSSGTGTWEDERSRSVFSQLGNTKTVFAEADFTAIMPLIDPLSSPLSLQFSETDQTYYCVPPEVQFSAQSRLSWEVGRIDPRNVSVVMARNVPEITQQPQAGLTSAHAGQAMVAKFWEEWAAQRPSSSVVVHSDYEVMNTFKNYEDSASGGYVAGNLNKYFDTYINPNLKGSAAGHLSAVYRSYLDVSYEQAVQEIQAGHPFFLQGKLTDEGGNQLYVRDDRTGSLVPATHSSVAYGIMEDGRGGIWFALRDTWNSTSTPLVEHMDGDRMWVQDGGFINSTYGYDTAKWYPSPNVTAHEPIGLIPKAGQSFGLFYKNGDPASGNALWSWESFTIAKPLSESPVIAHYVFDGSADLENVVPISNPLGKMEIVQAPEQLGVDGNVLHLLTPDGSPIGFGLNTILPEDFEIGFKYAGLGDGTLQLALDGNVFKNIDFSFPSLGKLVSFEEAFNASALGIDPYDLYQLSFILKAKGDPDLYLNDLFVRNLNAQVVPEPASMLLFGVGGLVSAVFKRKKKNI